jgi:hypothetical protein
MSQPRDEINDFLMGGGAKAFPFESLGDSVRGIITEMKKMQQTDFKTGAPVFWDNGDPKMMLRVTLKTELHEDDDDEGYRSVYLRGGNTAAVRGRGTTGLVAVKDAVKKSGSANGIEIGGDLTLAYTGEGNAPAKGMQVPKLYTAAYLVPSYGIDVDEMA